MSIFLDEDGVREAYEAVRNDNTDVQWLVCKYEGKKLGSPEVGSDYSEMLPLLGEDDRAYCYARFETGDEMSRRAKFAFITWIGPSVGALKKAKVSTDKAFVKAIISQFGKEILADDKSEMKYEKILKVLEAASGAAYGTGK